MMHKGVWLKGRVLHWFMIGNEVHIWFFYDGRRFHSVACPDPKAMTARGWNNLIMRLEGRIWEMVAEQYGWTRATAVVFRGRK